MAVQQFEVKLDRTVRRRVVGWIVVLNLAFTATTIAFMLLWSRMGELSPRLRWATRYILVQGHLATENVVAAWYSSMLLLAVSAFSLLAWMVDRRQGAGRLRTGWLIFAVLFAALSLDEIGSLHERIGMIPLSGGRAVGWMYLLALPIAAIAALMIAFAWAHVRRARSTMVFLATGVVLFVCDPVLESVEMALIHGAGATPGTWQRFVHDVLLVVEEGGLELFGILCFLAGIADYVARTGSVTWTVERLRLRVIVALITVLLVCSVFGAEVLVSRLPAGDSGIARNWFPAAAWFLVAAAAAAQPRLRGRAFIATGALAASAICGAGLYVYVGWLASRGAWFTPVAATLAAGLTLEVLLSSYFLMFSPRSSIASPTLRRPRPNPS